MDKNTDKKVTIYDIAKISGVSPATVSRVIHQADSVKEATQQKVWQAFKQANVTPEELSIKTSRTAAPKNTKGLPHVPTILVCLPGWDNPFYNDIIEGIRTWMLPSGYETVIYTTQLNKHRVPQFLEFADSLQASGLIIMNQLSEDILYRLNAHFPIVQCSEYNPHCQNIPYVSIDDYAVAKSAVSYLIKNGCEKIAFFTAPYENRYVQNRFLAYKTVLQEAGIPAVPEYVLQVSDFSYDRILTAANRLFMLSDPPDGVFAVSDKHAHAVIKAAQKNGFRVPDDIKVFGFDNTMFATLSTPTITTVNQPRRMLGTESARLILEKIKNPNISQNGILLPAKLVFQESA